MTNVTSRLVCIVTSRCNNDL